MPFVWNVTIRKKTAGGYEYDPPELAGVEIGDQIVWANDDDQPHWPGRVIPGGVDKTYFMAYQIAPHSPSDAFVPGANGTLTYVDSLDSDPNAPKGSIVVG